MPRSRQVGPFARCAARRSIPPGISVRGATAIPTDRRLTDQTGALEQLRNGRVEILGRLADASNATFLCSISTDDAQAPARAVYKPTRGERPLDDFPSGTLAKREVASYVLSEATGWRIVPPTVMRDGPFGPGMVQMWIESDPSADVVDMIMNDDPRLRRMCVFDVLANNADRKAGHVLPVAGGHIYGVDHGICFAVAPKVRTVLWGWRGRELSDDEIAVVRGVCEVLDDGLGRELAQLLTTEEVQAIARRAERLLQERRFPQPDPDRPALPWPPF